MAEGNIDVKIKIDSREGTAGLSAVVDGLKTFERETQTANTASQQLTAGLKAFSWTTFTQGALNASTAIAQLYTSVSNLNRVQYLVKQATVSVERAEDQLARKTMQLTKEIEKNGAASEKAKQLRNEIGTATEQLANKQERLALAMDQVNDTYILFGSNIANTVFGVIQTLIGLKTMAAQRIIANKTALDQETISLGTNAAAARLNAAAHSSMIASRSGLIAGISPLSMGLNEVSTGMGVATKATGLLSSTLGKAGLIGSIAAVGISLGAFAYDQLQSSNQTQKTIDRITDLSKSVDELGKTINQTGSILDMNTLKISNLGAVFDTYAENINQATKNLQELKKAQTEMEKDLFKPSLFGPSQAEKGQKYAQSISDYQKGLTQQLIAQTQSMTSESTVKNILGSFLNQGVGETFKTLGGAKWGLAVNLQEEVTKQLEEIHKISEKTGRSFNETAEKFGTLNHFMLGGLELQKNDWIDVVRAVDEYNRSLEESNKLGKQNNEGFKEQIKLLKEIGELKKKTSLSYQRGIQRTLFDSLVSGDYTVTDDILEKIVGSDRVKAVGYQPFSGYLNKKTKEIRMNLELVQAADWLYTQTEVLGSLVEALRGTAPDDPMRGKLLEMIELTRKGIETSKSGPNFASSYPKSSMGYSMLAQFSNPIAQLQRNWKGYSPTFGGLGGADQTYTNMVSTIITNIANKLGYSTSGAYFRDNAYFGSLGRLGFSSSQARSTFARQVSAAISQGQTISGIKMGNVSVTTRKQMPFLDRYDTLLNYLTSPMRINGKSIIGQGFGPEGYGGRAAGAIASAIKYYKNVVNGGIGPGRPQQLAWYSDMMDSILNSRADKSFLSPDPLYSILASRFGLQAPRAPSMDDIISSIGSGSNIDRMLSNASAQYNSEVSSFMDQIYSLLPSNLAQAIVGGAQGIGSAAMGRAYMSMMASGIRSSHSGSSAYLNRSGFASISADYIQSLVNIYKFNNYGIFDAIIASRVLGSYFSSPELAQEIKMFESQIQPILNISYGEFSDSLVDPRRGYDEIDDRLRYTSRLEQISTGATLI